MSSSFGIYFSNKTSIINMPYLSALSYYSIVSIPITSSYCQGGIKVEIIDWNSKRIVTVQV